MTGRVVWLSTSPETRGGIATYVRGMQATPLWRSWDVLHIATHRDGSAAARVVAFARGAARFIGTSAVHRPALVHVHMASRGSFFRKSLLTWIAHARGLPVVIHVHGGGFEDFYRRSPRLVQAYIRASLDLAEAIIALGPSWAERLTEMAPGARVLVVPNAITPRDPVEQGCADGVVRVLFLGDVIADKGVFVLLDAWHRVLSEPGCRAELVLAGDGLVDDVRARTAELGVAERVRVLGWVSPEEVQRLLHDSHVLVLPSFSEGQPMAVLEAMSYGLCVVASDVGGIPDLIDADCGVLVPPGDAGALTTALRTVITDEDLRVRLGARASDRVRDCFSLDQTWRVLDALYTEVAR